MVVQISFIEYCNTCVWTWWRALSFKQICPHFHLITCDCFCDCSPSSLGYRMLTVPQRRREGASLGLYWVSRQSSQSFLCSSTKITCCPKDLREGLEYTGWERQNRQWRAPSKQLSGSHQNAGWRLSSTPALVPTFLWAVPPPCSVSRPNKLFDSEMVNCTLVCH